MGALLDQSLVLALSYGQLESMPKEGAWGVFLVLAAQFNSFRDPIVVLRTTMEKEDGWTDADMSKLDEEIKAVVQDAWDFADASPEPPLEALYEDVLVDTTS